MRLETRTGLAALAAAVLALVILAAVATNQFEQVVRELVDEQLEERSATAPVLVAVGDRVAVSELDSTIAAARVLVDGRTIDIGRLPDDPLPPIDREGFRTATADGEDWRLYTVRVDDVPAAGDTALVELAAPLGDVDARVSTLRGRMALGGLLAAALAGVAGLVLGRRASRPLTDLRNDAAAITGSGDADLAVQTAYGAVEVDDVARTLNDSLRSVADASTRREEALVAARAFAASATHELRTPLQSAMTNLDVELAPTGGSDRVRAARSDLDRMKSALEAVRAFSDAELVDPTWFETVDVADLAEEIAASASRGSDRVSVAGDDSLELSVWPDGVRLALDNLVRNALTHGRVAPESNGTDVDDVTEQHAGEVIVTIDAVAGALTVDDGGVGIAPSDRERLLQPFERGATRVAGSGLGLAFVARVAAAHDGDFTLDDSPLGGTRAILVLRTLPSPPTERS
ncbi:MAG: sensor histidine kinase [Ilumatobacter sp.]|uniref:sensor histidine kinase n=1 Tax=Ilumatobacter sp. TaxID=1967498 RepID=UPI00391CBA9C